MFRTALDVVVVTLCTKLVEVGETLKTHGFEFIQRDGTITILVKTLQDSRYNVIRLLLMLDIVLDKEIGHASMWVSMKAYL